LEQTNRSKGTQAQLSKRTKKQWKQSKEVTNVGPEEGCFSSTEMEEK
jgi:hypothetical protein